MSGAPFVWTTNLANSSTPLSEVCKAQVLAPAKARKGKERRIRRKKTRNLNNKSEAKYTFFKTCSWLFFWDKGKECTRRAKKHTYYTTRRERERERDHTTSTFFKRCFDDPVSRSNFSNSESFSSFRAHPTTVRPLFASSMARDLPRPLEMPEITTTLSDSSGDNKRKGKEKDKKTKYISVNPPRMVQRRISRAR